MGIEPGISSFNAHRANHWAVGVVVNELLLRLIVTNRNVNVETNSIAVSDNDFNDWPSDRGQWKHCSHTRSQIPEMLTNVIIFDSAYRGSRNEVQQRPLYY